MYKLVYTHTKSKIAHALNYATHTFYVSLQCQVYSREREREREREIDIVIHVILKKNKAKHKINYFCLFENFQCFWIFLKNNNKKNLRKPNNQKLKKKKKNVHK